LVFRGAGSESVRVGDDEVPVGAFLTLANELIERASVVNHADRSSQGETIPAYLIESDGGLKCDVTVPEERAEVLWNMLRKSDEGVSDVVSPVGKVGGLDWGFWEVLHDQMMDAYDFTQIEGDDD
jgi:hypothetical protein